MSGFELVSGIIAAFFVIGIGVGMVVVIALSALRYRRAVHGDDWRGGRYRRIGRRDEDSDWQEPPGPAPYDEYGSGGSDGPPRWPDR